MKSAVSATRAAAGMVVTWSREQSRRLTEESLGYASRCVCDRVFPPHPDPLPPAFAARQSAAPARRRQGEGRAGLWLVCDQWWLGKLRHGCDRETVDHPPSPQGRGKG